MFNILLDDPPVDFRGVKINTDFRQGLKFFRILAADKFDETMKARLMITAIFDGNPWGVVEDPQEVMDFIGWYISGGREGEEESEESERLFDWNVDNTLLFSAFFQVYGINLRNAGFHWWEFLALFNGLPDNTKLSSIIDIRGKEIPEKADAKYKAKVKKLKRLFAIDKDSQINKESLALDDGLRGWR